MGHSLFYDPNYFLYLWVCGSVSYVLGLVLSGLQG